MFRRISSLLAGRCAAIQRGIVGQSLIESLEHRTLFASISGMVFVDRNNNQVYDTAPDSPIGSASVYIDANNNQQLDNGETTVATLPSSGSGWGTYTFNNVNPGTYNVRAVVPIGYVASTNVATNGTQVVTLANTSSTATGVNFGFRDPTQSSTIGSYAFNDFNGDGVRGADDTPLAGLTVYADLNLNKQYDSNEPTGVSDSTGMWAVSVLNPGYTTTYHLRAIAPTLTLQTTLASTGGDFVTTRTAGQGAYPTDAFGFVSVAQPYTIDGSVAVSSADPFATHYTRVNIGFQENITYSTQSALAPFVTATLAGGAVPAGSIAVATNGKTLTLSFPSQTDHVLPTGRYRATLPTNAVSDSAGRTNSSPITFDFIVVTYGNTLTIPAGTTSVRVQSMVLENTYSTLEMNDSDLLVDYGSSMTGFGVQAAIKNGYAAGAWTGTGIRSLAAKNNPLHNTSLGFQTAADFGAARGSGVRFDGETLLANAMLVKYAYNGDINFDGKVDANDYARIDAAFQSSSTVPKWFTGDLNYDGKIDANDYALIDAAYQTQGSLLVSLGGSGGGLLPAPGGTIVGPTGRIGRPGGKIRST